MLPLFAALAGLAFTGLASTALAANQISGSAHNQTRGQPAAGDDVILLRLHQGMQEEARAKTDARGAFSLPVQFPAKSYLVRVIHQGVNYDQRASSGDALSIEVFDTAPRVEGVAGSIEILRTGTNGNLLHVSDMIEIRNQSRPPVTQAGDRTFDVYLPANAKIDSVLAAGPGNIAVLISAVPLPGDPGHYAVNFPLRPGATKFAFNYDLPYDGHVSFQTKHAYPLQQLVVMIPPSMKFSSRSPDFQLLETGNSNYQFQAVNHLNAGKGPAFEVFERGALPPLAAQPKSISRSQSPPPPHPRASAVLGTQTPSSPRANPRFDQPTSSSQSLVLESLSATLLAACAVLIWRARKALGSSCKRPAPSQASQSQRN
jgi:hypothetical protein